MFMLRNKDKRERKKLVRASTFETTFLAQQDEWTYFFLL
tara:strand:+ start:531 stop:647 length:117 start_codon:yes stop_codon:yes gene_type:complete